MKLFITLCAVLIIGSGFVLVFRYEAEAPVHHDVQDVETIKITEGNFSLKLHESKTIPDAKIVLSKIVEDSRCPIGVQCIWAGTAKAEITIVTTTGTSTEHIELGKSVMVGNNKLTFTDLSPSPQAGKTIDQNMYECIFTYANK